MNRYIKYFEKQGVELDVATYSDIMDYVRYRQDKVAVSTLKKDIIRLRKHYESINREANPCTHIKIKGDSRIIVDIAEYDQLEGLYKASFEKGSVRKVVLGLIVFQALDTSEISRLKLEHIDLDNCTLYVPSLLRTNSRTLNLSAKQLMDLVMYLDNRPKTENDYLLVNSRGKADLEHNYKVMSKQLPYKLKQIRRSIIVEMLKTKSIREVQYLTGMKYASSVERYSVYDIEELRDELEMYHPY